MTDSTDDWPDYRPIELATAAAIEHLVDTTHALNRVADESLAELSAFELRSLTRQVVALAGRVERLGEQLSEAVAAV
ncbi:MAG TPA: hypothetical protein VE999_02345 [Gemmataceae bacterium]|nr:hypothetical protein [Gemmataceae bacterium]